MSSTAEAVVELGGPLGEAIAASRNGRLAEFITDERSPAIALFDPARARRNYEGDWYGEHAGKWLAAAARAGAHDERLAARARRVADYLVSVQEPDGYLGTYAPERRFTSPQLPAPPSWDGAPALRTWDVWCHAYLVLGLLEVYRRSGEASHLEAARRIGDLAAATFARTDVTALGNHFGLSATVFLDAAVELHRATGELRYRGLAERIVAQADARAELRLVSRALEGADASEIGTGKAYQLLWNMVGLCKLHRADGGSRLLDAALHVWRSVRDHHLTLGGGPWGGVALRSRECFNHHSVFDPRGYVETCSTLAWIQLNRELLAITGEPRFADEIERSAYNDLLGAMGEGGHDWCYYSFPNGRRVMTTYWRCCKSSGALALEELPAIAYQVGRGGEVAVNLYGAGRAALGEVELVQRTDYPFGGTIEIDVARAPASGAVLALRVPDWAGRATIAIGDRAREAGPGAVRVEVAVGDTVRLELPMVPRLHRRASHSVQVSRAPDGEPVEQEVMRRDYLAVTRGPLVYASGPIDGWKHEETFAPPADESAVAPGPPLRGCRGPSLRLTLPRRAPLDLAPYFEAGGRADGGWRLTWLTLAELEGAPDA